MSAEAKDVKSADATTLATNDVPAEETSTTEISHPGERLRIAREAAGLQQEDIAAELRLDLKLIKALEEGDLVRLPEPVFTAGYLRSYARLLGLPSDEVVAQYVASETRDLPRIDAWQRDLPERYRKVANALPNSFSLSAERHNLAHKPRNQAMLVIAFVVVAIGAGFAGRYWFMQHQASQLSAVIGMKSDTATKSGAKNSADASAGSTTEDRANTSLAKTETTTPISTAGSKPARQDATSSSVPSTQQAQSGTVEESLLIKPLPGTGVSPAAGEKQTASMAQDMTQLSLRFSDTSWVDIRDATGKRLIRELGLKGANKNIEGVAPFTVLLGYGPGVEIAYNGKPFDFSRFQGDRIARFTLNITDDQLNVIPEGAGAPANEKAPLPEPEDD